MAIIDNRAVQQWGDVALSYVESTLGPGEEIIFRARFPWVYTLNSWLALLLLGVFVVGIVIFIERTIRQMTTEIVVTSRRFVVKTGFIARKTQEVSLEKIEQIKLNQSFWGRILDYGSLDIRGTGVGNIQLPNIDEPLALRRAINAARGTHEPEDGGLH
jgi:uncharacterized membrane protein YdbT with pleckstrin-like domain